MNDILDKLDSFLEKSKESEQKLFFLLPILIFGFLSYYFLYPITDRNLINAEHRQQQLTKKISSLEQTNLRLKNHNLKIMKILKIANVKLKKLHQQKDEVSSLVKKLSFLKFDLEKWGVLYNEIPTIAKNNKLIIMKLDNILKLNHSKKLIQENMVISMKVIGDFVHFIKLMHYFEAKKELLKVKSILMKKNEMDLTISIYGAQL
jgi:hypothetical protein